MELMAGFEPATSSLPRVKICAECTNFAERSTYLQTTINYEYTAYNQAALYHFHPLRGKMLSHRDIEAPPEGFVIPSGGASCVYACIALTFL